MATPLVKTLISEITRWNKMRSYAKFNKYPLFIVGSVKMFLIAIWKHFWWINLLIQLTVTGACHTCRIPPTSPCRKQVDPQFWIAGQLVSDMHLSGECIIHFSRGIDSFPALLKTERTLSFALQFYTVRSVYLRIFKLIPFKLLMLCTGQSLKYKINK